LLYRDETLIFSEDIRRILKNQICWRFFRWKQICFIEQKDRRTQEQRDRGIEGLKERGKDGHKDRGQKGRRNVGRTKNRWTEKIKELSGTYRSITIERERDEYTSCKRDLSLTHLH
jgi:hypothetical protein